MLRAIIIWLILVAYIIILCKLFSKQMASSSLYERAIKPSVFMQNTYDFRQNIISDIDPTWFANDNSCTKKWCCNN